MLRSPEYLTESKSLLAMLPTHARKGVVPLPPGSANYRISFRVPGGRAGCQVFQQALEEQIFAQLYTIRSITPTVSIEIHPDRRIASTRWHAAQDALKHHAATISIDKWEADRRYLSVVAIDTLAIMGSWDSKAQKWNWIEEELSRVGAPTGRILLGTMDQLRSNR